MSVLFVGLAVASLLSAVRWDVQSSGTTASLRGVCPVSRTIAWASGAKGTVLKTTDGGDHWQNVSVPGAETLDFRDIEAFDERTAFVLACGPGDKSRVYRTTDGGKTWRQQFASAEPKAFYDGFAFRDRTHGFAMSDPIDGVFRLLWTEDGETWKPLPAVTLPPALPDEGGFAASGTGIAVFGTDGVAFVTGGPSGARLFLSPDRGKNWTVTALPIASGTPAKGAFSLAFAPEKTAKTGVVVGGDYEHPDDTTNNSAFSADGGRTWTTAASGPSGYRSAVAFVPGSSPLLWVTVGTNGSDLSRDGGKTWEKIDGENYNAVRFSASGHGWAVGPKGRIARFVP